MIVRLSHLAGDRLWTLAGILNQHPRLTTAVVMTVAGAAAAVAIVAFLKLTALLLEEPPPRTRPLSPTALEALARFDRPGAVPRDVAFPAERVVRMRIDVGANRGR